MTAPAIKINGGAAGVKAACSAASAVTATLDSTAGVRTVAWSIASTDETSEVADYTLVQSGTVGQNVATTSLAAGTAAILKAIINGGINLQTGLADAANTTATAKFYVATTGGLEVGAAGEEYESDATYGSTGIINSAVRSVAGSVVSAVTASRPIVSSGGTTPVVSWLPNANVTMAGYTITNCGGVTFGSGAINVTAGGGALTASGSTTASLEANGGNLTLDSSAIVKVGNTNATRVDLGRSGQDVRLPALAGGGTQSIGVDNDGDIVVTAGSTYTAGAGLTESPSGTFNVATADGTITVNADSIEASGAFGAKNISTTGTLGAGAITGTSLTAPSLNASGGTCTIGASTATVTASGTTTTNLGTASTTNNVGMAGATNTITGDLLRITADINDAGTSAPDIFELRRTRSGGNGGNGIGLSILASLENASGTVKSAGYIKPSFLNATAGSETTNWSFWAMALGGAAAQRWDMYYDSNYFGDYVFESNVFSCDTTAGYRFKDSANRGGLDQDGSNHLRLKSYGSKDIVFYTGADASGVGGVLRVTISSSGLVTVAQTIAAPVHYGSPTAPTSSAAALTINIGTSQNAHHTTTENTTVTITGGTSGQDGTIVFSQGASGKTITMPTDGSGVEYDNAIEALGLTAIVDTTALTRTLLRYYVLPNGKAYIFARSVVTIP